eukprot:TRINITY_DN17092_c0_g1_i3.p2 TRINITY_DN17092_c0_g1~~TRINITY_DN17092_c0_g1_i3.p2  ORF type:complete len:173 (-),score=25.78 TRINITY_DN17092_c0_g1_i3:42-560(-)
MVFAFRASSLFRPAVCQFQAGQAFRAVPFAGTPLRAADRNHTNIPPHSATGFAGSSTRRCSTFNVKFISADGDSVRVVSAKSGQTILEVAHKNDIDIEGACGGECACSTCHVILDQETFDKLPEADEDEVDMLDLAIDVVDTSRLGCQVKLQQGRDDDLRIHLPAGVANLMA